MNPAPFTKYKTRAAMGDGRNVTYYDFAAGALIPAHLAVHRETAAANPPVGPRELPRPAEMRWNPTLAEWTVYAAHRMSRPMLPAADACPLCPGILELPLPYQVAIFENRAPALSYIPGPEPVPDSPNVFELTLPGRGRCDIVVYSQQHDSKLAFMAPNDVYGLVEAWRDRYAELIALPEVRYVSIIENKGREAGMTLDHPHGQIYALPFLPPILQKQWDQTLAYGPGGGLWERILAKEERDGSRIIAQTDGFVAAIPFYAKYPYEVHIWARRAGVHSLLQMTTQERRELAAILRNIVTRYENLWPDAKYGFPTLMLMQQLSDMVGVEQFRFHIELYPLQRSPDKLKYRAAIESGTGTFLNDALPETQAAELRDAAPHEVELPPIIFDGDFVEG